MRLINFTETRFFIDSLGHNRRTSKREGGTLALFMIFKGHKKALSVINSCLVFF